MPSCMLPHDLAVPHPSAISARCRGSSVASPGSPLPAPRCCDLSRRCRPWCARRERHSRRPPNIIITGTPSRGFAGVTTHLDSTVTSRCSDCRRSISSLPMTRPSADLELLGPLDPPIYFRQFRGTRPAPRDRSSNSAGLVPPGVGLLLSCVLEGGGRQVGRTRYSPS